MKIPENSFLRYGGAAKAASAMNKEELAIAAANIRRRAAEKAFSRGLPLIFLRNGEVVAEFQDGSIVKLEDSNHGTNTLRPCGS